MYQADHNGGKAGACELSSMQKASDGDGGARALPFLRFSTHQVPTALHHGKQESPRALQPSEEGT